MVRSRVPRRGDVYWIDPNPTSGREMRDRHRFVVVSPAEVNAFGVSIAVPITTGGSFAHNVGIAVPVTGHDTIGVAVCNQLRTFDVVTRLQNGTARFVESLDEATVDEIVSRVVSLLDPEE